MILLLTISGTFIAWQQAVQRADAEAKVIFDQEVTEIIEAIQTQMDTYIVTLQGFRGLFHSSDQVNEKEFQDYYTALDLEKNLPGFRTLNYVSRVTPAKLPQFLQDVRTDTSLHPGGNPDFSVTPAGERPEYFIITYEAVPEQGAPRGTDLTQNDIRHAFLAEAQHKGEAIASDTVSLLGTDGKPSGKQGFILTIPTYKDSIPPTVAARAAASEGFINISFAYDALFTATLKDVPSDMEVSIRNGSSTSNVYAQGNISGHERRTVQSVVFAGHELEVQVTAPQLLGANESAKALPMLILAGGAFAAAVLIFIFWLLSRSRTRALKLASKMTEDLRAERNAAVAAKVKDEAILTSIGDGVFALDASGTIVLFNKAAAQLSGYTAREALGQPYDAILRFRDTDGKTPKTAFITKAQSGERSEMAHHTVLVRKDGTLLPVADSAAPIFDAEGNQQGIIVVFRDVTTEAKFQTALEESNERFKLASQATNDVVYDLDLVEGKLSWNDSLYDAYGYTPEQVGDTLEWWTDHIHPDDAIQLTETLDKLSNPNILNWTVEYRFQRADGRYAYIRDRAFVQRDQNGQAQRLIGSMLDITQQKQLDQAKDEFVSLVSHQLRTPLTAIRLFVEMLAKGQVGELTGQQKDYLEKVEISTERMIRLVGDILNVSRIELGRIKIEPIPTDVHALIKSHLDEIAPLAAAKKVMISFTSEDEPVTVDVDPTIFGQVVHNLLTNAIRYTNSGKGKIEVRFTKEPDGYQLAVSDNGIGIPAAARPHIFERFYRAENATKVEGEGTGLGLYLIKLIMDTAGGTLRFESKEGEGTTFYAHIPIEGMKARRGEKTLN